jgi:hypothetical protein
VLLPGSRPSQRQDEPSTSVFGTPRPHKVISTEWRSISALTLVPGYAFNAAAMRRPAKAGFFVATLNIVANHFIRAAHFDASSGKDAPILSYGPWSGGSVATFLRPRPGATATSHRAVRCATSFRLWLADHVGELNWLGSCRHGMAEHTSDKSIIKKRRFGGVGKQGVCGPSPNNRGHQPKRQSERLHT